MKSEKAGDNSLSPHDPESGEWLTVIETPKGSRNKFKYDEKLGLFKLAKVLPAGAVFPFDFGFIPSTRGGDGDPLDVLILMEEPAFPGCVVSARLIGVIEANQTDGEGTERNDRLIAVAAEFHTHSEVRAISDLSENLIDEIEHFFISYHQIRGKQFEPLGRFGPDRAEAIVKEGMKNFRKARRQSKKSDRRKKSRKG